MKNKVLIFIVAYHAEKFIQSVLERIPRNILLNKRYETEILLIDDQSSDRTFIHANEYAGNNVNLKITVLYNPKNQGYGGNQKIGYHYAINNAFDVVVLLHGDGQYAPECLEEMIVPILNDEADAVIGSRMINKFDALKNKMPLYKWLGNQILTFFQNKILKANLSEFHSGYRAYSVSALASIPFTANSDYFDFDTDIIIQLLDNGKKIHEIPIKTYYGDEICRVNGLKYGKLIIYSTILSRIQKLGLFYHPKFDYRKKNYIYSSKFGYPSSHQFALERVKKHSTVLDIGCVGFMAKALTNCNTKTISIDRDIQTEVKLNSFKTIEIDIENYDYNSDLNKIDTILALDIIEHLKSPELFLYKIRKRYCKDESTVIITTGNIAFILIRLGLLCGIFNYGPKGILDLDHKRLFTFYSLRNLLHQQGFDIIEERGIPAPFPLVFGDNLLSRFLLRINMMLIFLSKTIFSYQIGFVAKPKPTLDLLLQNAYEGRRNKINETIVSG